ncbi:MAG: PCRF domain-containing protein [Planctomycetes bacterium]|nr:PCRF domain-containing protein [Planctomycetota bacterium]
MLCMWDEVEKNGKRFLELRQLIEDPASPGKPQYPAWLKEYGRLTKFGALYEQFLAADKSVKEAEAILKDASADADFKALAKEELSGNKTALDEARNALLDLVATEDEDAGRNVIVEIYAGVGGDESALWVGDLFEMYKRYCDRRGWKMVVQDTSEGNAGGMSEVSFRVEGAGAFGDFRFEGGGHRVQRVPKTETQGRIHTSMARVAVLPEVEDVEVQVDPKEVKETFCAAGGPGGQNVNKVASQCQLKHIPTGITVRCMETRSQRMNQQRAWQILRSKLYALKKAEADKNRSDQRLGQIGSGDRSDRIRTYNFPQARCTDHRLEGEDKNWPIQAMMEGKLEDVLARLKEVRRKGGAGNTASAAN